MSRQSESHRRADDLFGAFLGAFAGLTLISSYWNVDTEGPDPFYKGPLIFPLIVLSGMVVASLPSFGRLLRPPPESSWYLDGAGAPRKTLVVLGALIAMIAGLGLVGLEVSSGAFLIFSLYVLGHRGAWNLIALPLGMTILIALVFKHFLGVFFPTPLILDWWVE